MSDPWLSEDSVAADRAAAAAVAAPDGAHPHAPGTPLDLTVVDAISLNHDEGIEYLDDSDDDNARDHHRDPYPHPAEAAAPAAGATAGGSPTGSKAARRADTVNTEGVPDEAEPPYHPADGADKVELGRPECLDSLYGAPVSPADAAALCPAGDGGLVYHAQLVPDDWTHPKHCTADGKIKPRRPILPVRATDFFGSVVQAGEGRWVFSGVLNGWPALTCLEVRSITCVARVGFRAAMRQALGVDTVRVVRFWDADDPRFRGVPPSFPDGPKSVRVTLRGAPWSSRGWSPTSPGFCWWFEALHPAAPRLSHGEDMIANMRADVAGGRFGGTEPLATTVHHFAHRYARPGKGGHETTKERNTYHGALLVEWSHGEYCTVIELATLFGVGGRMGKANWHHDKLDDRPALYRAMPSCMVGPWKGQYAEVRCNDVPAKSLADFKEYVAQYTGAELRFLDPHFFASAPVRLAMRRPTDIMRYLLNYIGRDMRYAEGFRNCQTFSADAFGFLAGKAKIEPFHPVNRVGYVNRVHNFLYEPGLYGPPHR